MSYIELIAKNETMKNYENRECVYTRKLRSIQKGLQIDIEMPDIGARPGRDSQ